MALKYKKFSILFRVVTFAFVSKIYASHPIKIDFNKKLDPKQKTIQAFNIDA